MVQISSTMVICTLASTSMESLKVLGNTNGLTGAHTLATLRME